MAGLALGLLALIAELVGRSLTHRINIGRHVGPVSYAHESYYPFLLGPRSEQIPFTDGALCLGQWQRILLFSLDARHRPDWKLTLVG